MSCLELFMVHVNRIVGSVDPILAQDAYTRSYSNSQTKVFHFENDTTWNSRCNAQSSSFTSYIIEQTSGEVDSRAYRQFEVSPVSFVKCGGYIGARGRRVILQAEIALA
jgi:hypothetical protein